MTSISASASDLESQACTTARNYFDAAVRHIDDWFGKGYAKAHPELISVFMNTCGQDYTTAISLKVIEEIVDHVTDTITYSSLKIPD